MYLIDVGHAVMLDRLMEAEARRGVGAPAGKVLLRRGPDRMDTRAPQLRRFQRKSL